MNAVIYINDKRQIKTMLIPVSNSITIPEKHLFIGLISDNQLIEPKHDDNSKTVLDFVELTTDLKLTPLELLLMSKSNLLGTFDDKEFRQDNITYSNLRFK